MRAELQRRLSLEDGAGGLVFARKVEANRYEVAVARHEAEVSARSDLERNVLRPLAVHHAEDGWKRFLAVRTALLVDRLEVGGQRKGERFGLLEQPAGVGFDPASLQHVLFRPGFGELQQRILLRWRSRRLLRKRCLGGAPHDEKDGDRRADVNAHSMLRLEGPRLYSCIPS